MHHLTPLLLCGLLLMMAAIGGTEGIPLELDLSRTHDIECSALPGGGWEIRTTGRDPYVHTKPLSNSYVAARHTVLSFDYLCDRGLPFFELFYGPPIRASHRAKGGPVLSSEGWTQYALDIAARQQPGTWRDGFTQFRLDFGDRPGRVIQVRNLRLREPTPDERRRQRQRHRKRQALVELEKALTDQVTDDYPARIDAVIAKQSAIRLRGSCRGNGQAWLCEAPLYTQPLAGDEFAWEQELRIDHGRFDIELPRRRKDARGEYDRIFSSWMITTRPGAGWKPLSAPRFADEVPARWDLPRVKPESRKGTTGMHAAHPFQFEDYRELGIRNCTKNIVVNSLLRLESGPGCSPFSWHGRTYYVVDRSLAALDASMRKMDQLDIVVSAILLIGKHTPMTHPDCDPAGIWAMPDVTTETGWNYYAAALDLLASRYSRPDRKYGRITHWILHNEVDAGWVWTNAGEKPLHVYFDLYYRSLRTAYYTARQYNPHSQVFISLTHYWTRAHNQRCYPPQALLDLLATRSAREGDFEWGVAQHPYPQNLRDPRAWLDTDVSFSFDTPLITPKNLEVLDAYMHRPEMRCQGNRLRTVILSEQGPNSPDHTLASYRDQAAGLVYMWLKMEPLESVESFILHRWMDAPPGQEGGLLLGLWTNRPDHTPPHEKKPAWEIYRLLGTDRQPEAVRFARRIIGDEVLAAIPYRGRIRGR